MATAAERMASAEAAGGQPQATQAAVAVQGLARVFRAAWKEAATWRNQRRDGQLVKTYQRNQRGAHVRARSSSVRKSVVNRRWASGDNGRETLTMMSSPFSGGSSRRNVSRDCRFRRLRNTAVPVALRLIARPRRGSRPPFGQTYTCRVPQANRRRAAKTCAKSLASVSRRSRGNPSRPSVSPGGTARPLSRSGRQAQAPLCTAVLQNAAAAAGAHAVAEAVASGALELAGLVCAFHGDSSQ